MSSSSRSSFRLRNNNNNKVNSTNTKTSPDDTLVRKHIEHVKGNLPCSFFPQSFFARYPHLLCINCTNLFNRGPEYKRKSQEELGQQYQCIRLRSVQYHVPLRVVATVKLSEGLARRKRVTQEQQQEEICSAGDVSSLTSSRSTASTLISESQATDSLFDATSEGTEIERNLQNKLERERNQHQVILQQVQMMEVKLYEAEQEIKTLKSSVIPMLPPTSPIQEREKSFANAIEVAGKKIFPGTQNKTKAIKVYEMLKTGKIFNSKEIILNKLHKELTSKSREVFRPWKLRKMCDECDQGGINASGCGQMREVQELRKYERGLLPEKTPIVRAGYALEAEAKKYIDWELRHLPFGEMTKVKNLAKFVFETLRAYDLHLTALVRLVDWAWSADGADLTGLRKHTSLGGRPLDLEAKDPFTKELLFHNGFTEDGLVILKNYHTKEIANFMVICGTNETQNLYREDVRFFFEFMKSVDEHGLIFEGRTYKIAGTFPADMSCHWKVTGMGGACKVKHYFCHHCACASDKITYFKFGDQRCDWCKAESNEKCCHFSVDTDTEIERKRSVALQLERKLPYLMYRSKDQHCNQLNRETMMSDGSMLFKNNLSNHIEFEAANAAQLLQYSNLVTSELLSRNLAPVGGLEERRTRLKQAMYDEDMYLFYKETIERHDKTEIIKLVKVEWTIPCIMHMHNRVTEKIVTCLLRKGFSIRASQEKKDSYRDKIELTMNQVILGSSTSQSKWSCPMTQDKSTCTDISFTDGKAKTVMLDIVLLISDAFCDGEF